MADLHSWLNMLRAYNNGKPLSRSLTVQIEKHFQHFWANDRL